MSPDDERIRPGLPDLPTTPAIDPRDPAAQETAEITSAVANPKTGDSLVELARQSRRNGASWVIMLLGFVTALFYGVNLASSPAAASILIIAGVIVDLAGFSCRWRADIGAAIACSTLTLGYLAAYFLNNGTLPMILCCGCGAEVFAVATLVTAIALETSARAAASGHPAPQPRPQTVPPPVSTDAFAKGLPPQPPPPPAPPPVAPSPSEVSDALVIERPPLSKWAIAAAIVFATSLTGGYAGQWDWAIVLGPICAAIAVVFCYRWVFPRSYVLTDEALESIRPRRTIPYADMVWVISGDVAAHDRFSIYVMTADRTLMIGPSLSCDSQALLAALQRRVPRRACEANLPASLESFFAQQLRLHARDRIHVFHALPRIPATTAVVTFLQLALALILAAPLLVVLGFMRPGDPSAWAVPAAAFSSAFIASTFVVVAGFLYSGRAAVARRFRGACLIITPDGLAIRQRHLHGEMRWNEILGGKVRVPPRYGDESAIELDVGGAEIRIADAYDASPHVIAALIEGYSGLRLRR